MSYLDRAKLMLAVQTDFFTFLPLCFSTLHPGAEFLPNWHIAAIAHLWDGMPTITTTASSVVWMVGVDPPSYRLSFRRQRSSEEDQADFESQQGSQRRIAKPILRAIDRPSSVVDDDRLP